MMATHYKYRLSILILLVSVLFLAVVPSHGESNEMDKPREAKRMKGKRTKKTKDLPRHRIKRIPQVKPEIDLEPKRNPQETNRQLKNKSGGGGRDFKGRGGRAREAGRGGRGRGNSEPQQGGGGRDNTEPFVNKNAGLGQGASSQATSGGAASAGSRGQNQNRQVPVRDWSSWGTVWVAEPQENTGNGNGNNLGREAGRFGGRDGRGANTDGEDNENGRDAEAQYGGREANNNGGVNNPYQGEERWRDQFVTGAEVTPRPTRRPSTPPPVPLPTRPRVQPTPAAQTSNEKANDITRKPTPNPTPAPESNSQANGQCQLCGGGQTAIHLSRTLIGTNVKCQDIANTLATVSAAECDSQKEVLPVDVEAYCGCPGKSSRGTCTFCPPGTENIWHNITIPALNDWTCQDVEDYVDFVINADACAEMAPIADLCCGTWEEYWAEGDDDWVDDHV